MHQQTMHVMNIPLFFLSLLTALPLVAIQTLEICVCVLLTLFPRKLHNRREKFLTTYYFPKTFYGGKTLLLCWEAILHQIPPLLILRFGEWTLSYMLGFFFSIAALFSRQMLLLSCRWWHFQG